MEWMNHAYTIPPLPSVVIKLVTVQSVKSCLYLLLLFTCVFFYFLLLIHSNHRFSFFFLITSSLYYTHIRTHTQYPSSMCGRFACSLCPYELRTTLRSSDVAVSGQWKDEDYFHPSYNVAPRKWIPVVRYADSDLILQTMASESLVYRKYTWFLSNSITAEMGFYTFLGKAYTR